MATAGPSAADPSAALLSGRLAEVARRGAARRGATLLANWPARRGGSPRCGSPRCHPLGELGISAADRSGSAPSRGPQVPALPAQVPPSWCTRQVPALPAQVPPSWCTRSSAGAGLGQVRTRAGATLLSDSPGRKQGHRATACFSKCHPLVGKFRPAGTRLCKRTLTPVGPRVPVPPRRSSLSRRD